MPPSRCRSRSRRATRGAVSARVSPAIPSARPRSAVRVVLLLVLVCAAAFALLGQPHLVTQVREGRWLPEALFVAPALFSLFVLVTLADTLILARKRKFLSGRSLLQVGFALAVLAMLTPSAFFEYRARKAPQVNPTELLIQLAENRDARVRALVMEVAGYRLPDAQMQDLLGKGLEDADPLVQEAAVRAISATLATPLENRDRFEKARETVRKWRDAGVIHGSGQ